MIQFHELHGDDINDLKVINHKLLEETSLSTRTFFFVLHFKTYFNQSGPFIYCVPLPESNRGLWEREGGKETYLKFLLLAKS